MSEKMESTHTDGEWEVVRAHFDAVLATYVDLLNVPGVAAIPAIQITFTPLLRRYQSGERSDSLYDAMMEVE